MVRQIRISEAVIGGEDMQTIVSVLPQLESSFKQRKEFWEFTFEDTEVELSLEDIEQLSDIFTVKISFDSLVILV
jgi:hypothetical protein